MKGPIYLVTAVLTAAVCFPLSGHPQTSSGTQELLIDQLKRTVVYLQGDFPCHEPRMINGVQAITPEGTPIFETICHQVGTGFLFNYPTLDLGPERGIALLVISKHLIQHQRLGAPKGVLEYFEQIIATANTREPNAQGSYVASIPIGVKINGFLNCSIDISDPEADVAVCPIGISDAVYDFKTLAQDMCVTHETIQTLRLNETDEVLFSGLFLPYRGAKKNYPIVRHGRLALIPKEKIPWSIGEERTSMQDLYLAEVTSWGGNSGSPVFVRLSGVREEGSLGLGVRYFLLGVMQGYFGAQRPAALDTAATIETAHQNVVLTDNSGIAAIVPAEKIAEILAQSRVKAYVGLLEAMSYAKAGNPSEAESWFKKTIEILQASDPDHPLLRDAFIEYGTFLRSQGRHREADFRIGMGNSMNKTSNVPDEKLR